MMNNQPPAHYREYWRRQDEDPELDKMARSLLSNYIQNWSQTNFEKTDTLTKVAQWMGYKVETIPNPENSEHFGWDVSQDKEQIFSSFVEEVRNISRGNFESETNQLARIILKYRIPPTLFSKFLKWLNLCLR